MLKLYYCLLISQNPVNPPDESFIKSVDTERHLVVVINKGAEFRRTEEEKL